jgi:hypothetical protein
MGNTNIPQFGAADTENSRDTRAGKDQLTDKQKKHEDEARKKRGVGPAPGRPASAPERTPGQRHEDNNDAGNDVAKNKRNHNSKGKYPGKNDLRSPGDAADIAGSVAITGHVGTGHSSRGAT